MKIIVISNESQERELAGTLTPGMADITWIRSIEAIPAPGVIDAMIHLLFDEHPGDLPVLQASGAKLVIINSVTLTLEETDPSFVRINGWNGFLEKNIIEAAGSPGKRTQASAILAAFHKTIEWLPDLPGFIGPRVISMIINEAFLSFSEGVSSKEQINTAMKLGTNYPLGPFEWAEKIGHARVKALLDKLSENKPQYSPANNMI